MKFSCPKCRREEEIILDRHPRCSVCRVEMIPASDYSEVWMSPYIAIALMQRIQETYGIERARSDGRFKKEREAWTTAILALGLTKLNGEEWWIEIVTTDNTPDTKIRRIDQISGNNVIQTRSIEVVDWEENVDDIMEVIRKKCQRAYPKHYLLLVFARHSGRLLDFEYLIAQMKKIRSPFLEVWVVAFAAADKMKVVRVAPSGLTIDLDIKTELQHAIKQQPFLKRGRRGTGTEMRDLGLLYLPVPRGD